MLTDKSRFKNIRLPILLAGHLVDKICTMGKTPKAFPSRRPKVDWTQLSSIQWNIKTSISLYFLFSGNAKKEPKFISENLERYSVQFQSNLPFHHIFNESKIKKGCKSKRPGDKTE